MTLASMQTRQVRSADGTRIDYTVLGNGPALVICHGSLSRGTDWQWVAGRLAPRHRCYLMTRRGRGAYPPASSHALARECEDLAALLRQAGPGCSLLAHSYGALCALETLRPGNTDIGRLILYEPPLNMPRHRTPQALDRMRELLAAGRDEAALRHGLTHCMRLPPAQIEQLAGSFLWQGLVQLTASWLLELTAIEQLAPQAERYAAIRHQTLLLVGACSPPHLQSASEELHRQWPTSRQCVLDGQGHDAHLRAPRELAAAVADFLARP